MRRLQRGSPLRALNAGVVAVTLVICFCPAIPAENREPGFDDLVIMDPGVHENGLPAVIFDDESRQVEIPPALHIHRYYYSGDKNYQGPIISGGPTVIVANHPKTNEKMYIDVMLPSGAPEIWYTKHNIVYVYPDKRVLIQFSYLLPKHVKVAILPGRGVQRAIRSKMKDISEHSRESLKKSSLVQSLKDTVKIPTNVTKGAFGLSQQAAGFVVDKAGQATNLLPGVQALKSLGEQSETRGAQEKIRQAGLEKVEDARKFFRTNR